MEELKMRCDTIQRLSRTSNDYSIFEKDLFSTLLQTANGLVEDWFLGLKGSVCCDDFQFLSSSFDLCRLAIKPEAIARSSCYGNHFIVLDRDAKQIFVLDKEGSFLVRSIGNFGFKNPVDIAVGLNDQIVVLDEFACRVVVLDNENDGSLIRSFGSPGSLLGQLNRPSGVAIDNEGRIVVVDGGNHRLQVFRNNGSFLSHFWGKGERSWTIFLSFESCH